MTRYDVTQPTFVAFVELITIGIGFIIATIEAVIFLYQSKHYKQSKVSSKKKESRDSKKYYLATEKLALLALASVILLQTVLWLYSFFDYNNEDNKNYILALFYAIALSSATSSILIFYIFRLYLTFKETTFAISKRTLKSLLYVAIISGIITLIGMFIRLVSLFNNAGIGWILFTASWTVCIFEYILLAILFSKKLIKLVTMQKSDTKAKINQLKRYYHMHAHSQNNISTTFDENSINNYNNDQNENINTATKGNKQNSNNKKNNNSKNRRDKKKKKKNKKTNGNDVVNGKFTTDGDMPGATPNFKKAFSMSQSSVNNINGNQLPLPLVSNDSKDKAPQTMMIRVVTPEASDVDTAEEDNSIGNNINNTDNNGNSTNKKDADYISDAGADADGNLSPRAANKFNYSFGNNNNNNNNNEDNNNINNNNDSRNPSRSHSRKNSRPTTPRNLGPQVKRQHIRERSRDESVELSVSNSRSKSGGSVLGISQKRISGMNVLHNARKSMLTDRQLKLIHNITKQTTLIIIASMSGLALTIGSTILGIWPENIYVVVIYNIIRASVAILFQSGLWLSFIFAKKQYYLCCSCCHRCNEFLCVKLVVKREGIRVEDAIEASIGGSINVNRNGNGDGVAIPVGGLSPVSIASTNDNSKGNSSYPNLDMTQQQGSARSETSTSK